jgi:NADH-quinone oxidoreductase subunit K
MILFGLIEQLLGLALSLFILGLLGLFVFRRTLISILLALEIILLAINLNFLCFSLYLDDSLGMLFSFFILAVAGAESSIGLALLVVFHRITGVISIHSLSSLRG